MTCFGEGNREETVEVDRRRRIKMKNALSVLQYQHKAGRYGVDSWGCLEVTTQ